MCRGQEEWPHSLPNTYSPGKKERYFYKICSKIDPRTASDARRSLNALFDNFYDSTCARIYEDRALVNIGVPVVRRVVLGGNLVVRHTAFR